MGEVGKCWCGDLSAFFEKSKPSLAMIFVQFGFAGMNIISKMALNQGMSHFVLVFYRHLVATIVTAPLAYFLERITLNQIFYYSGLKYTTATFASALINLIPVITFLMAIIFRMEKVDFKSRAGQAKIIGTLVCVSGAMSMTFYKGIKIQLWPSPFHFGEHNESDSKNEDLTKGSLMVKSISKKYPAQYSSTTIMCSLVTIQSAVLTLVFERGHYGVWILGWNVKLLTAIYSCYWWDGDYYRFIFCALG
ncbi:hypothetical protein SUGI_0301700 [Cryptomeria japonica]|nr:hypothetical protein SUGI_0301700 [Cryptomeria japonica]